MPLTKLQFRPGVNRETTSYTNEGLKQAVENGPALSLEPGQRVEASIKAVAVTGSDGVEKIDSDGLVVPRS